MLHKALPRICRAPRLGGEPEFLSMANSKLLECAKSLSQGSPALNKINPGLLGVLLSPGNLSLGEAEKKPRFLQMHP